MKANRIVRAISMAAVGALALGGASALAGPANAAKTSVTIVASNALTSFNPSQPDSNLVSNSDVAYLQGFGFNYYDSNMNLVKNTTFGSYTIVSKAGCGQAVKYTVRPGRVWSDGTPIDGVDLLLSHVLNSNAYSIAAKLGDPDNTNTTPKFDSIGYGGVYSNNIKGTPTLSSDHMSVTLCYGSFQPDWEIMGPGPSPVHTLVHLAAGKTTLQSLTANKAAKATFLSAFLTKNTAKLSAYGAKWSTVYDIKNVSASTNKLLFVGNGGYTVTSAVADQYVTLTKNPKYNSGPAMQAGITKITYKFMAEAAATQALANHEVDIYQGQPTVDSVNQLKAMNGVSVLGGTNSCFEHVDLRVGDSQFSEDSYTGPFAMSISAAKDAKARDIRNAFLLAYPRQAIVDTLVKPVNSNAVVVNSSFLLPGQTGYTTVVAGSGVSKFTTGTQAQRTAKALALMQEYYPSAGIGSDTLTIKMLWGALSNSRRAAEFALAKAELNKIGINLTNPAYTGSWSGHLDENSYDVAFFAWCPSSNSQTGTNANFRSNGGNNHIGYASDAMDAILDKLETKLSSTQVTAQYLAAEKLLIKDAVTLPIFAHPAVTAYTTGLKGIRPAPLTPNLVWNYWQWRY